MYRERRVKGSRQRRTRGRIDTEDAFVFGNYTIIYHHIAFSALFFMLDKIIDVQKNCEPIIRISDNECQKILAVQHFRRNSVEYRV